MKIDFKVPIFLKMLNTEEDILKFEKYVNENIQLNEDDKECYLSFDSNDDKYLTENIICYSWITGIRCVYTGKETYHGLIEKGELEFSIDNHSGYLYEGVKIHPKGANLTNNKTVFTFTVISN